jgi:glycosyltransferase
MTHPWLSIITVVKDDQAGFERTVESLSSQDLSGVELIIVDSSMDHTAIPGVLNNDPTVASTYQWEPPAGIYSAMNSAVSLANGRYSYFLNAGDCLHDPDAVAQIGDLVESRQPEWLYAQVCFIDEAGNETTPPPFDYALEKAACFARGRFPPHQGVIAQTALIRDLGGFDTSYRVAADYALILRLAQLADPAESPVVLADFQKGGLSTTAWRQAHAEFHRARREILAPRGLTAVQEYAHSLRGATEMFLFRSVIEPYRNRHRREQEPPS